MTKNLIIRMFVILSLLLCLRLPAGAATIQAKVVQVDSGNTVVVTNINRPLRVRLKAVVPPESGQAFSDAAREHLKALVLDKAVAIEYTHLAGGYLEAKVFLNGIDIGSQMLRDGVAWYDRSREYELSESDRQLYAQCEQLARNEKRGLWQDSAAVAPWEFRKAKEAKVTKLNATTANPTTSQSLQRSSSARRAGLSSNDMLGPMVGPGSIAGTPTVRPIAGNGSPDRWMTFESSVGRFSIFIPSNAIEQSYSGPNAEGHPVIVEFIVGGNYQGFYALIHVKGPNTESTDAAASESVIRSMVAGMNQAAAEHYESDRVLTAKLLRQLTLADFYGRQYTLTSQAFLGSARVFTKQEGTDREYFVVFALSPRGVESSASQFLNSFKIK
jgi:endonuclease YncB( thermonuclease family)